jgi:hypothetical protein
MSRPVAWRQWPACCRRAVPSSISSSCLGSLSQQVRNRVVPQANGKILVKGFVMTCAPCPHEYIIGPIFWANPFFKNHFNIIPPSSEWPLAFMLSDQSLALVSVQNPNFLWVLESSAHSTSSLFPWPRMSIAHSPTFDRFGRYPWHHTNAKFPNPGWTSAASRMRALWSCHSASCVCSNV